jgi:ferric-dicitrate binding protein FerR (iron transport regulator)
MPTRKQRRRRAKEQRHEYVWEDAEGNELDPSELPERKAQSPTPRARSRPVREPQAPSWRRTFRRALIFAPIMFVTVMLLSSDLTLAQQLTQTALIVAIFIPFSYFLDGLFWRSYKRRAARQEQAGRGRGG